MNRIGVSTLFAGVLLAGFGCAQQSDVAPIPQPTSSPTAAVKAEDIQNIRTPHFVDSAPAHGDELAASPLGVVINTNFDIVPPSSISITVQGQDVAEGETEVGPNRLSMRRAIRTDAPDGIYLVQYHACWPDKSCHDGQFAFSVDPSRLEGYQDLRGKPTVTIGMKNVKFDPEKIVISPGTHIVWVNNDPFGHYVNTDPHPTHNYYPAQNSFELQENENYELTLNDEGEYLYHCSAHTPQGMYARIVVRQ